MAELPDRDLVVIGGPEPNFRWQEYTARLLSMLRTVRPEIVVLLGSLLTDAPHTRPVPVSGTASSQEMATELGLEVSDYEGPTGIVGVLAYECARAGFPVVSLWASVPHYVAEPPNPKATLALLTRLEDVLNLPLEAGELVQDAQQWVEQVNELVADDPTSPPTSPPWRNAGTRRPRPPAGRRSPPSSSATCDAATGAAADPAGAVPAAVGVRSQWPATACAWDLSARTMASGSSAL